MRGAAMSPEALGQTEGAAAHYQQALELQPDQRPILNAPVTGLRHAQPAL